MVAHRLFTLAFLVWALLPAARAAAQPLVLGPETAVDASVSVPGGTSPSTAPHGPTVAFDGTNYLVVWSDVRGGGADASIYAARFTAAGALLDPQGILVSDPGTSYSSVLGWAKRGPAVAFDGTNYLVVWLDAPGGHQVFGARVSPAGQVLDPAGFRISIPAIDPAEQLPYPSEPTVVFDGARFLVACSDYRHSATSGADIYAAHVTVAGEVVEPGGLVIADQPGDEVSPMAASNGGPALVAWINSPSSSSSAAGLSATRVSAAGTVLDVPALALSTSPVGRGLGVVGNGTKYLVAWGTRGTQMSYLSTTTIDAGGQVGSPVVVANYFDNLNFVGVGYDGQRFVLVANSYQGQPAVLRFTDDGVPLDPVGGVPAPGLPVVLHGMAFGAGRFLVAGTGTPPALVAVTLDASGTPAVSAPVGVVFIPNTESFPAAAFDGSGYVVTWLDSRANGALMAAPLDENGSPRNASALMVTATSFARTAVASGGGGFFTTWQQTAEVALAPVLYGVGVTGSGQVLTPSLAFGSGSSSLPTQTALAFGDGATSVVWTEQGPVPKRAYVVGARVGAAGTVVSQGPYTDGTLPATQPTVACSDSRCLLSFTEALTAGPSPLYYGPGNIQGMFIGSGTKFTIASGSTAQPLQAPTAVFGGGNWLVMWQDVNQHTLSGVRVDANASVLDAAPFTIVPAQTQTLGKVSASFDGVDYLVAWEAGGIRLARVTTGGTVLDPGGVAGPAGTNPALAGRLIAYARPVNGTSRVFVRLRSLPEPNLDGGVDARDGASEAGADGQELDAGSDSGVVIDGSTVADGGEPDASMTDASAEMPAADASADTCPADAATDLPPPADAATDLPPNADAATDLAPSADAATDLPPGDGAADQSPADASSDATPADAARDTGGERPADNGGGCQCDLGGGRAPLRTSLGLLLSALLVLFRRPGVSSAGRSRRAPSTFRRGRSGV